MEEKQRKTGTKRPEKGGTAPGQATNGQTAKRGVNGSAAKQAANVRPAAKQRARRRKRRAQDEEKARKSMVMPIILIVAGFIFLFSAGQLALTLYPYFAGGREYDEVRDLAITADEVNDGFTIDFDFLKKENSDVVAWIRFEEPSIINYPVVQSKDNEEYLTKTFFANDNKLGAIFVDMRNTSFEDRNVFIYGHNLKVGGEMFSQLNEYADEEFCKRYPYFYIYTPDKKVRTYKVFSAGVVKADAENYQPAYPTEKDFTDYLELCKKSSNYEVDVKLDARSKIVSLSTCTNVRDDERFLVQGVLISED